MNRIQITSVFFIAVLISPFSPSAWGQAENTQNATSNQYLPAYPPGPYGRYPVYLQPVPWGAAPGWMPPPVYRQPPVRRAATTVSDSSNIKFEGLNTQIETLHQAVNKQQTELEEFQKSAAVQQKEIDQLLGQVTERDERLATLESELMTVTEALDTAKIESVTSHDKFAAMEAQNEFCNSEVAGLNDKIEQEALLITGKSQEVLAATEKTDSLTGELSACNRQLAKHKEELVIARAETAKLVARFEPEALQATVDVPDIVSEQTQGEQGISDAVTVMNDGAKLGITAASNAINISEAEHESRNPAIAQQSLEIDTEENSNLATQEIEQNNAQELVAITPQETSNETLTVIPANITMPDFDRDGINDTIDLCLDTKPDAKVDTLGCNLGQPIVMNGVAFSYDSHELSAGARSILDNIASILEQRPDLRFEVAGHTDAQGDSHYNKWLSGLRAHAVRDYLIVKGLLEENLLANGYGAEHPIVTNDTRDGLRINRRVELRRLE